MTQLKLGLGTSGIMGTAMTDRGRVAILEHAYQQGIMHFDTAPLYGQGDAEKVLGKFINHKRDQVTITTKFGLFPTAYPRYLLPLKPIARFANRRLKQVRSVLTRPAKPLPTTQANTAPHQQTPAQVTPYNTERIITELERSLIKLKTDHVDYFLLHDCLPAHINDDVVECLQQLQQSGKTRFFGLATGRNSVQTIIKPYPELTSTLQLQNTPFSSRQDDMSELGHLLITHSVFANDLASLKAVLQQHKPTLDQLIASTGNSVMSVQQMLTRCLLHQASHTNPQGVLLFSSSNKERITHNATAARDSQLNATLANTVLDLLAQT